MRQPTRRAACCAAAVCLFTIALAAQDARFPASAVTIAVSVSPDMARVRENYVLDRPIGEFTFEILNDSCSIVDALSATIDGRALRIGTTPRGPWTDVHVTGDSATARSLHVDYDVRLTGVDAAVPLAVPAGTLENAAERRGAEVTLRVDVAGGLNGATVSLPRMRMTATDSWEARFLAIPSVVTLRLPSAQPCRRALPGPTGGLEWRFWTFVATMAIWIPIYFRWIGRRDDPR